MSTTPGSTKDRTARATRSMRFPRLFGLLLAVFVVDLFIPDVIPFADEIALGLARSDGDGSFTRARLGTLWRQRLAGGARVELNAGAGLWRSQNVAERREYRVGDPTPLRRIDDDSDARETSANLDFKFSQLLGGDGPGPDSGHSFVAGTEVEGVRRNDRRTTLQDGVPLLTEFGDNLQASSLRGALYAQDEWAFDAHWALHAGLRWEGIQTQGDAGDGTHPSNVSSVWTPLVHLLWKPDPKKRDQLRLSLTRSYRSPSVGQLIARPSLNPRYPVDVPNDPTHPDSAGNPGLRPELASGLDLAFERYLDADAIREEID